MRVTTTKVKQQKILKAKVAVAMYSEFGKVPSEAEIDQMYHMARVLYKAVLGTHYLKRSLKDAGQLVLF